MASVNVAKDRDKSLRIVLVLKGQHIADASIIPAEIPIEAIHFSGPFILDEFPSTGPSFTVSRSLDESPTDPLVVAYPIRILVVTASPTDKIGVQVEAQRNAIREGLKGLAFDDQGNPLDHGAVQVKFCDPPTWDKFRGLLREEGPWHIVHFAGHGAFEAGIEDPTQRAKVLFEKLENRESDPVGAEELSLALAGYPDLKLVVLTACSSAAARPVDPDPSKYEAYAFDGIAQRLLRSRNVSAVIAMQFDLEIEAAKVFSKGFYRSLLADGQDIDVAVAQSRRELAEKFRMNSGIWITPVLYTRCLNGRVFEFPARLGLAGIVMDAEKLRPVEGIELRIEDLKDIYGKTPTAVTDSAGQFRFQGLPPGPDRQVHIGTTRAGYRISPSPAQLGNTSHRIKLISDKSETR